MTLICDHCGDEEAVYRLDKNLVGFRCRICNEVMFTEADYRTARRLLMAQRISKFLLRWFPWLETADMKIKVTDGKVVEQHVRMNGFVAGLSDEQKAAALAYRGDDTHGRSK
jgi:hypothetical protein